MDAVNANRVSRHLRIRGLHLLGAAIAALMGCVAIVGHVLPGTAAVTRPRVIVSTDIGGTDPDDFQSMVHLLLYADVFDLEGADLVAVRARAHEHILEVIDRYERDYPKLRTHRIATRRRTRCARSPSRARPRWRATRACASPTDGSRLDRRARAPADPRPLYVLVWGGIEDLAQALHDAPDILPKLRVYFIGGPNKKWSVDAYHYIEQHHPTLWMIEANSTYRGWFVGGNQAGDWGNAASCRRTSPAAARSATTSPRCWRAPSRWATARRSATCCAARRRSDRSRAGAASSLRIWDGRKTTFIA